MKVVLKHAGRWLRFSNPEKVLRAERIDQVVPMLRAAENSGLFAAGFLSYEAAPAFDAALTTRDADGFPLLCIGLFHAPDVLDDIAEPPAAHFEIGELKPSVTKPEFCAAIGEIKARIAEGATYQVNYTYRLNAGFSGDPWAFFYELVKGQKTEYAAFVETDDFSICSASPELFFSFNHGRILARPMKGTARRGLTFADDWNQAEALRASEKDRAENIMIVDMIRNDIGRVAEPGSVETLSTFDVEKYPTVWQMTSTVKGELAQSRKAAKNPENLLGGLAAWRDERSVGLVEVMEALFPCASITGAPKAKTMQIIAELETSPRKIYTGAIGFISPRGEACFNVAIRTALIQNGSLEFGVGGGIVWDSDAGSEYEETLTKARVLTQPRPEFRLLETMLWAPDAGIFLLDEHLQRLAKSAAYFDIPLELHDLLSVLEEKTHTFKRVIMRLRLLVSRDGAIEVQAFAMEGGACFPGAPRTARGAVAPVRMAIAKRPVNSQDVFLYHKTTHRAVYETAKADFPDHDDVILWNEKGEVTESTIANVVVRIGDRMITPPVACGLLPGTLRAHLLKAGEIEEGIVTLDDLRAAEEIYLINSVRGWQWGRLA
ncbi:chorismate-binding protein [Pontiella sp.]|uniref:bifunctional chorismate-binding protein/class IV aminotransferase n=1 Tax=Pontiella sp. TaxID=2837462 RepID=UPI003565DFA5